MIEAAEPATAREITTLAIAIFGAVTSVTSLAWQVTSWRLSGGRSKALLLLAGRKMDSAERQVFRAGEEAVFWNRELAQQGYNSPMVGVRVVNTGRIPIVVRSLTVKNRYGKSFDIALDEHSPSLPSTIPALDAKEWFVSASKFGKIAFDARSIGASKTGACFEVTLQDGKHVRTEYSTEYNIPVEYRGTRSTP
jgi:hypothetical protein